MSQTDAMLFEHWLRERNADAFRLLATRYASMVYQTCRRILNNASEAEDVTQECFVILASTNKPIGGYLAPWLHRVAYNRSLARLRAENRRREREVRYVSEQPVARDMAWDEIGGHVDEAIAELPEKLRAPIVAYFLDGQTQEAISLALGIPRSTVTYRVDKGVECLRKSLKSKGVAIAGTVLAGAIKANASAEVPATLVASLGKLALSGVSHVALPAAAAAAPLAKSVAGFLTAKTLLAGTASLALVLFAGFEVRNAVAKPKLPAAQMQASGQLSAPSALSGVPAVSLAKAPEPRTEAAAVAPVRKDEEKAAPEQAPPQGLAVNTRALKRFQASSSNSSIWDNVLNSLSNLWRGFTELLSGEGGRRSSCQNNMKQFGLVFKMFANEQPKQCWPALDPRAGHLIFANENPGMQPVYPEYLADPAIMLCPDNPEYDRLRKMNGPVLLDDYNYLYLGYTVFDIEGLKAFSNAYKAHIAAKLPFEEDIDTPNGKLYRLREGVERFLITDLNNPAASAMMQSRIPVLIELPEHDPMGGNVLFMDGHVEFIKYADRGVFPMDKESMDILKSLRAMKGAVPLK